MSLATKGGLRATCLAQARSATMLNSCKQPKDHKKSKSILFVNFLFYIFSSLALISAGLVIQVTNPVHSVLFLILVFFNAAGLLILIGLEFFAMVFLVVYIGAIAVLFLFVVMMLNIKLAEINEKKYRYLPIGGLLGILFLFEIFCIIDNDLIALIDSGASMVNSTKWVEATSNSFQLNSDLLTLEGGIVPSDIFYNNLVFTEWSELAENLTNIQSIGQCIYTYYSYFFICASFILLVAMIGAIVLTHHQSVYVQTQKVLFQNTREFSKTIQKHKGRPF